MQHTANGALNVVNLRAMPTRTRREEEQIQVTQADGDFLVGTAMHTIYGAEYKNATTAASNMVHSTRNDKKRKTLQIRTKVASPIRGCLSMPDEVDGAQQSWHPCHCYGWCVVTGRDVETMHTLPLSCLLAVVVVPCFFSN